MNEIVCPLSVASGQFSDEAAIVTLDDFLTFNEYDRLSRQIEQFLRDKGLKQGDRIVLIGDINPRLYAAMFAAFRLGLLIFLLSKQLPKQSRQTIEAKAGIRLALHLDNLTEITHAPGVTKTILPPSDELPSGGTEVSYHLALHRPATAILTSGSEAAPKIAVHSLANHYFSALGLNQWLPLAAGDRWLQTLPLHHVGGLCIFFRAAMAGATLVLPDKGVTLADSIRQHGVSHLSLVSTQLGRLLDELDHSPTELPSIKSVLLGGSAMPSSLLRRGVEAGLPLVVSYGLTEMTSTVTTRRLDQSIDPSVGQVLPYRQLTVSESGEVKVRGEALFQGYLRNGIIDLPVDPDGWFATGDMGRIDDKGELFISGRRDAMFVSGGENIQPEEIETALLELAEVKEAMVVPVDHARFGQRPVAFIRWRNNSATDEAALAAHLKDRLESFKIPDHFFPWPPENMATLKPSRAKLAEIADRLMADQD